MLYDSAQMPINRHDTHTQYDALTRLNYNKYDVNYLLIVYFVSTNSEFNLSTRTETKVEHKQISYGSNAETVAPAEKFIVISLNYNIIII